MGGALKNIFAIAAGAAEGMGLGLNATAMLVTRGCREMDKVALAMGASEKTLRCDYCATLEPFVMRASRHRVQLRARHWVSTPCEQWARGNW